MWSITPDQWIITTDLCINPAVSQCTCTNISHDTLREESLRAKYGVWSPIFLFFLNIMAILPSLWIFVKKKMQNISQLKFQFFTFRDEHTTKYLANICDKNNTKYFANKAEEIKKGKHRINLLNYGIIIKNLFWIHKLLKN